VSQRFFKKYFFHEKYDLTFNCIDRGNEVWIGFQCFIRCRFINEMIYLIILGGSFERNTGSQFPAPRRQPVSITQRKISPKMKQQWRSKGLLVYLPDDKI
jgi:hypothetical protein